MFVIVVIVVTTTTVELVGANVLVVVVGGIGMLLILRASLVFSQFCVFSFT